MSGFVSCAAEAPLLAGALSGFALAEVLQLLEMGRRSGRLVVDGGPLGGGWVQLRDGSVVATACTSTATAHGDHTSAVGALLELESGRWAFHADDGRDAGVAPPWVDAPGIRVSAVLVDAARRRDERVQRDASGGEHDVPRLAFDDVDGAIGPARADAAVRLTTFDLAVLSAIDGSRDVRALAALLRGELPRVGDALARLREIGVVAPRVTSAVGGEFG